MPTRLPLITLPGLANFGDALTIAGAASMVDSDLLTVPQGPIAAGNSFDTDPVLVSGYNSFGILTIFTGIGTLTLSYTIRDPRDTSIQVVRQVAAGLATNSFQTFGAFAVVGPADPFIMIGIRFGAVTNPITITGVKFLMATR